MTNANAHYKALREVEDAEKSREEESKRYRLDKALLMRASVNLDTEAERLTERLQITAMQRARDRAGIAERRAKLWRAAALLREICD